MTIQMVDLHGQYLKIKNEVDAAMQEVLDSTAFIGGAKVREFAANLERYLQIKHVIPCANGTDALQVAFMALNLSPGDEVIVPCFTYAATAEVIALLHLTPVLVDVDTDTFQIDINQIEQCITAKTKAIVPVHLFGQCSNMEAIMQLAEKHNLFVVEDTAQAIGAKYTFSHGSVQSAGGIGHFGTTSFFPSKNLGCFGDGGAILTNDDVLAEKARMICNHGQKKKYYHSVIGVNSRLDTIQAAVLDVKLKHLDSYCQARNDVADYYDIAFADDERFDTPKRVANSTHVFHQYTLKLNGINRDDLKNYLHEKGVPSMVYYPVPLNEQEAFLSNGKFPITQDLCSRVLSLPISTEMSQEQLEYIVAAVLGYK
ncbi:MAG: DegT/DnrJ/EryC1/StrS family aminotransferase [Flavobacteriales bacterium]|nr:DegT/DnrJ/EryC1/StrS family aminotransferase [Flavobacteriales bacterium]